MKRFAQFHNTVDEACWKGYTANGLKRKGRRLVPDCKRVAEAAEPLDERIVGGADFLQAAKNLVSGQGFRTNREVKYARVEKNYRAMKRRQARAAKKVKN